MLYEVITQWKCGTCSGPLVDGSRVYVVGNRGEILCLDREGQANGNDGPFRKEETVEENLVEKVAVKLDLV